MTSSNMNDGVALLLERMKTNPEEFAGDSPTKWKNLVDNYRRYLKKEDLALLDNGMKELMQQRFTQKVMEELIDPDRKLTREEKIPFRGVVNDIATASVPAFSQADWEKIRESLDKISKEHKTKFGKLFNYS